MSDPAIPLEVIDECFSYCDKPTLTACALASRDISPLAYGNLYRTLTVLPEHVSSFLTISRSNLRLVRHLRASLVEYAWADWFSLFVILAEHRQLVSLFITSTPLTSMAVPVNHLPKPWTMIIAQLAALPTMRSLAFNFSYQEREQDIHKDSLISLLSSQHLQHLQIESYTGYTTGANNSGISLPSASGCVTKNNKEERQKPKLSTLSIRPMYYAWYNIRQHFNLSTLRRLSLSFSIDGTDNRTTLHKLVQDTFATISSTLTHLELELPTGPEPCPMTYYLLSEFHQLRSLTLFLEDTRPGRMYKKTARMRKTELLILLQSVPYDAPLEQFRLFIPQSRGYDSHEDNDMRLWEEIAGQVGEFPNLKVVKLYFGGMQGVVMEIGRTVQKFLARFFLQALRERDVNVYQEGPDFFHWDVWNPLF